MIGVKALKAVGCVVHCTICITENKVNDIGKYSALTSGFENLLKG